MFPFDRIRCCPVISTMAAASIWTAGSFSVAADVDFGRDILPILSENCFHCHGPDAGDRKADLRLDNQAGATTDLGGHQALVTGRPDESAIIHRVENNDPDEIMPPPDSGKTLSPAEIQKLRSWILSGGDYEGHWSLQPVHKVKPPLSENSSLSEIDRFIVSALKEKGLSLSSPASRTQLIRRATFDLTGLPPTWKEVSDFVNDKDPDAFEKVIDRLLASPRYGERWGRHWLDVARYADTHGGSAIGFVRFPFSYTYRDYVIGAFNEDVPYDRFVLEQLAADQLGLDETDPARAALGFLTVGQQFRNRHDLLDDQIDVVTRGLLGLTVSCARCHDHKFDPIPTTDYYALHTALASSDMPDELPLVGKPAIAEGYANTLEQREMLRDDIMFEQGEVLRGRLRMQTGMYLRELAKGTPEQDTSTFFLSFRTEDLRPIVLERWRKHLAALDTNDPVFGPWFRLRDLKESEFASGWQRVIEEMEKENGDPAKFADDHRFATKPPKWNPQVLTAIQEREPKNFIEVADTYGELFTATHRRWMTSLLAASEEAEPGGQLLPDQDKKHQAINSAIERQLRHHLYSPGSPTDLDMKVDRHRRMLNRGVRDQVGGTFSAIDQLNLSPTSPPRAMELRESSEGGEGYVLLRGNPISRGEAVQAHFLSAISKGDPEPFESGHYRLGLAHAIVDPENPLTRRVIVNWIWQHHFERGLVRTPDDFGTRGRPPTHPELLDYLANALLEDGWSIKKIHKRIMLSDTYQQSSLENVEAREADPDNQLLWRMPPRKLEMEAMRDSMLLVSRELDPKTGGQPFEEKGGKVIPRRSVYAFVNRDVVSRMASTFDGANPSSCTVKRQETMVPQQTLFALNSDFIQNRAKAIVGQEAFQKAADEKERVQFLYRLIYCREPDAEETDLALDYLAREQTSSGEEVWSRFAHVLLASNEFHFVD